MTNSKRFFIDNNPIDIYDSVGVIHVNDTDLANKVFTENNLTAVYVFENEKLKLLAGKKKTGELTFSENDLQFKSSLLNLAKSSFAAKIMFRHMLKDSVENKRVLFFNSFIGAESIAALKGNAKEVVSIENIPEFIQDINVNLELNNVNEKHTLIDLSLGDFIELYDSNDEKYDIAILDATYLSDFQENHNELLTMLLKRFVKPAGTLFLTTAKMDFNLHPYLKKRSDNIAKKITPKELHPNLFVLAYAFYN